MIVWWTMGTPAKVGDSVDSGDYSKEELELLLLNMPAGVAIENENYEVVYMNEFLIRLFGNGVGKKCYEVFSGRCEPCEICGVKEIIHKGADQFRYTATDKDGRIFEITAAPLHLPDGSRRVIEISNEVTEYKELERMKVDFINVVAHEMRTPLAAVIGFNNLLEARSENFTDKQKRYNYNIKDNANKLKLLIDDMLDLADIDAGILTLNYATVQLYDVVSEVLARHQALIAEKNHAIDVDIPRSLAIDCDQQKVMRVMDNIVFNAVYYMGINGNVRISMNDRGNDVLVTIVDGGVGISKKNLPKIFDRFYMVDATLTRHCDRIGIGLTLAKGYVELHGGKIWAESEVGEGSTFYFTLPKHRMGDNIG
ncbi:MAG: ATP-binding protein [Euryarchaeota archaeon]|nr:ATP-binding protein [Euryarchaeota archaeon]